MREKILFDDNWLFHKGDINIEYPKDKGRCISNPKPRERYGDLPQYTMLPCLTILTPKKSYALKSGRE